MAETDTHVNPNTGRITITEMFGENLAMLLADKILEVYPIFPKNPFCESVKNQVVGERYTVRIEIIADNLKQYLPESYSEALGILMKIFGPENQEETGMFTHFYWLMPVGKFIEKYGLEVFGESMSAIEELTKRNTGEYAVRPFARKYPEQTLVICKKWARSDNFHLRRLASEGLRPKLPWATKLDTWVSNPSPVFEILEILKEDNVVFVKKSVANHVRDWLKVNPEKTQVLVRSWSKSTNKHTQWILKHAMR